MKFVIHEGKIQVQNEALFKARKDIYEIAELSGYTPFSVPTAATQGKGPLKLFFPIKNLSVWMQQLDFFNRGDLLLIQYPLVNSVAHFEQFLQEAKDRGIYTIAFVHDLNSLRYPPEMVGPGKNRKYVMEDGKYLPLFDQVITHNDKMSDILKEIPVEHAVTLQIFDYLYNKNVDPWYLSKDAPIVYAGSLNTTTSGFIQELKDLGCKFNLYSADIPPHEQPNVTYQGSFSPDNLLESVQGSFGLVWQGDSIVDCDNGYGQYLRVNSPHNCSFYLAAGLPVIVWSESALADFVEENKIGYAVKSLYEIEVLLSSLSSAEYEELEANVAKIGAKVRQGGYFKQALAEVEGKYERV